MLSLMNRLGFDVATLGNHEFDYGQAFLGRMLDSMRFAVVCANVVSDTATFPQMAPWTILERGGVRIGFVGVVTNYEGPGHPAGNARATPASNSPTRSRRRRAAPASCATRSTCWCCCRTWATTATASSSLRTATTTCC